ncbi:hypothetical protein ABT246_24805 [Streptomyces sp. NPDC001553]
MPGSAGEVVAQALHAVGIALATAKSLVSVARRSSYEGWGWRLVLL